MLRSFDLVVYAVPLPWHRPAVNFNRRVHFKRQDDKDAQFQIRMAWMEQYGHLGVLQGPIRLFVTAFMAAPKTRSKKWRRSRPLPTSKPDYDNLVKQVADALNGYAFRDDSQIITCLVRKRYALDPDGQDTPARWVITVEELQEGEDANAEGEVAGLATLEEPDRHRQELLSGARREAG